MLALFFPVIILNFPSLKICFVNVYFFKSRHLFFSHDNRSADGISIISVKILWFFKKYTHRGECKRYLVVWAVFLDFLVIKSHIVLAKSG